MTTVNQTELVQNFLNTQAQKNNSPDYNTANGFLFGLGITPEQIPVNEWMGYILPDHTTKAHEEFEQVSQFLQQTYADNTTAFELNQLEFPFNLKEMLKKRAALPPLINWIKGFIDALYVRTEFWNGDGFSDLDPDKQQQLYHCMLMIEGILEPEIVLEVFEKIPSHILQQTYPTLDLACDTVKQQILMICVMAAEDAIHTLQNHARELEKRRKQDFLRRNSENVSGKIGKNDACPCGSGKKFQFCCGAAHNLPKNSVKPEGKVITVDFEKKS